MEDENKNKWFWDLWIPFICCIAILHLAVAVHDLHDLAGSLHRIADQLSK